MNEHQHLFDARIILRLLGLPKAQQNNRSALCLLALVNLTPSKSWQDIEPVLIGITPIMEFASRYYDVKYAPNTRETVRRQTMHQFVDAGIVLYNPDNPLRPVNSPKAAYQIEEHALALLRTYGTPDWNAKLSEYLSMQRPLAQRYASEREMRRIPVQVSPDIQIALSPGEHSELMKAIIEEFAPRFVPGCILVYVGDTGEKWGYFDRALLERLGVTVDSHGKMPDVVLFYPEKNWLLLIESVTSHGPVDGKRRGELARLFSYSLAGLVYVTAFPSRAVMTRYLLEIAWETEVWIRENPSHLVHFDGERFLGPYTPTVE